MIAHDSCDVTKGACPPARGGCVTRLCWDCCWLPVRGPLLVAWAAGLCSQGIAAPAVLGPAKTKVEINDQKIIVIFFTNLSFNFFSVHLYDIRARVGVLIKTSGADSHPDPNFLKFDGNFWFTHTI